MARGRTSAEVDAACAQAAAAIEGGMSTSDARVKFGLAGGRLAAYLAGKKNGGGRQVTRKRTYRTKGREKSLNDLLRTVVELKGVDPETKLALAQLVARL